MMRGIFVSLVIKKQKGEDDYMVKDIIRIILFAALQTVVAGMICIVPIIFTLTMMWAAGMESEVNMIFNWFYIGLGGLFIILVVFRLLSDKVFR